MNVIDTNIWIYRPDSRDPAKQQTAKHLIDSIRPLTLPCQVGCEFVAASRKLEPFGFSHDDAWDALADMQALAALVLPEPDLWPDARDVERKHPLSFWDALLVATCMRNKVATLYTDDMGAPRMINGLSLANPFSTP
jgi:predicted nucleic acid-binding protein